MQVQNKTFNNNFSAHIENILKESRHELQERAHLISLEIDTHAATAKKDVHNHLSHYVKVKSFQSNTSV